VFVGLQASGVNRAAVIERPAVDLCARANGSATIAQKIVFIITGLRHQHGSSSRQAAIRSQTANMVLDLLSGHSIQVLFEWSKAPVGETITQKPA
jgi:hypothetical protein